jgi:Zn-dependent protease
MKWSAKLGEFFGIGVYVHATFLILLGWVGFVHWQEQQSLAAALDGMLFITALFACVVMHEYGHALTARRYGIPTTSRCCRSGEWRGWSGCRRSLGRSSG